MTMSTRPIVTVPNPTLRQKAKQIKVINQEVFELVQSLKETLENSSTPGQGLAAPQIGESLRIFVTRLKLNSSSMQHTEPIQTFINPTIVWKSQELNVELVPEEKLQLEGCLSIPKIYALIKRPWSIKVAYYRLSESETFSLPLKLQDLQYHVEKLQGFSSTLIQHEIDHLNGVLFTDHALKQGTQIYELREDHNLYPIKL